MKKILFPTDFSERAEEALAYALGLAEAFKSDLTLLHVYRVYSTSGMFVSVESYMKEDAAERMLEHLSQAGGKLLNGVRVDSKILRGEVVKMVQEVGEKGHYDLIVMGTKGASGLQEIFTGSTTNGVMKRTCCPVLAIPAGQVYKPPKNIVLAIDEHPISHAGVVMPLLDIARRFKSEIQVFHKDTGQPDAGIDPSIEIFLDTVDHSYHYELDTDHLNKSINDFVAETKADMLCMIRRQRNFVDRLFHVSSTTREVFDSPVPLLILHDEA